MIVTIQALAWNLLIYGRRCRSPFGWYEVGESSLLGPDLIYEATENV